MPDLGVEFYTPGLKFFHKQRVVWDLGSKTKQVSTIEQVSQWLSGKMLALEWKCRGSNPLGINFFGE